MLEGRERSPLTEAAVHQELNTVMLETAERLKVERLTIGFIPDGGRRGGRLMFPGVEEFVANRLGHQEAAKRSLEIASHMREHLPPVNLVVWGLSTDNSNAREQRELTGDLYPLIGKVVGQLGQDAVKHNERIMHIGRKEPLYDENGQLLVKGLPREVAEKLRTAQETTADNTGPIIAIAINYLGDDEMTRIESKFNRAKIERIEDPDRKKGIDPSMPFTRDNWRQFGDDNGALGDIVAVVRTSGANRYSNFGWRAGNAELSVIDKHVTNIEPMDVESALLNALRIEQRRGK